MPFFLLMRLRLPKGGGRDAVLLVTQLEKMKNPVRRNRNIGTSKQGHGQNNELVIPWVASTMKSFHERLENYTKEFRTINGNKFEFIIEETRADSVHACTVEDIAEILRHVDTQDYGRLNLIIFRQPKRKEEILSSVWGRLIYSYSFEDEYRPVVILEAISIDKKMKWSKSLGPEDMKELKRLESDGHEIVTEKRNHVITCSLDSVRNTQLYRTLPHEIGHYKHFLEMVGEIEDSPNGEAYEDYQKREELYHNLETSIKEKYAHKFAGEFKRLLEKSGVIPFSRIEPKKK